MGTRNCTEQNDVAGSLIACLFAKAAAILPAPNPVVAAVIRPSKQEFVGAIRRFRRVGRFTVGEHVGIVLSRTGITGDWTRSKALLFR